MSPKTPVAFLKQVSPSVTSARKKANSGCREQNSPGQAPDPDAGCRCREGLPEKTELNPEQ